MRDRQPSARRCTQRLGVWLLPDDPPPDQARDLGASLQRWDRRSRLLRTQAVRTVLGADVAAVSVDLSQEEDEREDDDPDECWCPAVPHCGCVA